MGRASSRTEIIVVLVLFLLMPLLASCSDDNGDSAQPLAAPSEPIDETVPPPEPVKITIGNMTDITGPSSNATTVMTKALEHMGEYYNDQNQIPAREPHVI